MTAHPEPTEAEFQAQIIQLAHIYGWKHMHARRSIGKGRKWVTATNIPWPDLTLFHPTKQRFLIRELKTNTGKPTPQQLEVLQQLRDSGIDADIWRPNDWPAIQATLTHGAPMTVPSPRSAT